MMILQMVIWLHLEAEARCGRGLWPRGIDRGGASLNEDGCRLASVFTEVYEKREEGELRSRGWMFWILGYIPHPVLGYE